MKNFMLPIAVLLAATLAQAATSDTNAAKPDRENRAADNNLTGVRSISAAAWHTCVLTKAGAAKCWGSNYYGQLGDNSTIQRTTPVDVVGLGGKVESISTGFANTCAVVKSGVRCWGGNFVGQLGNNSTVGSIAPVDVIGLDKDVTSVVSGVDYNCALTKAGAVKCWGGNFFGQLGDNSTEDRLTPVDVVGLDHGIVAIAGYHNFACALTKAGGIKCWGVNGAGQLGDNTYTNHSTPVDVLGIESKVVSLARGATNHHDCAIIASGEAICWGANWSGELGDGTNWTRSAPMPVIGLGGKVASIAAGFAHTCAVTATRGVKCWGANASGQLGIGTYAESWVPLDVVELDSGMSEVAAGEAHSCVLTKTGGVKCWGANWYGQLGDNSTFFRLTPVDVLDPGQSVRPIHDETTD